MSPATRPPNHPKWLSAILGILLGLVGVLWWQKQQDEAILRQMDAEEDEDTDQPSTATGE